jgi:prefoldin alpha subunit
MNREKLIEIELIKEQGGELQQHLQNMEAQVQEIKGVIEALQEFKAAQPGETVLIPLTNGIFTKGTLSNNETVLVNVGDNIVVEKSIHDTTALLEKQKDEIVAYKKELQAHFQMLINRLGELKEELKTEQNTEHKEARKDGKKK